MDFRPEAEDMMRQCGKLGAGPRVPCNTLSSSLLQGGSYRPETPHSTPPQPLSLDSVVTESARACSFCFSKQILSIKNMLMC